MINYIKDLINRINSQIYKMRVLAFEQEKLINDLKMRELECKQKQELIEELLLKLSPKTDYHDPNIYGDDQLIINPIWQCAVYDDKKQLVTGMPLLFWIHSHLKNYGFDPDNKLRSNQTKVRISMDVGKYVQFPLYCKGRNLPSGERLSNVPANIGEIDMGD